MHGKLKQHTIQKIISITILTMLISGCGASSFLRKEKIVKFPPTDNVDLLLENPEEPYVQITTIESRGDLKSSLQDLFVNIKTKGQEVGADAIMPTRELEPSNNQQSFEAYIVDYQTISGTRVPILRGYAIKYRSTIQKLKEQGIEVEIINQTISLGVQTDIVPTVLSGFGLTGWIGHNDYRLRMGFHTHSIPDFILMPDYEMGKINQAFFINADYFFKSGFRGTFVSAGATFWKGSMNHALETSTGEFGSFLLSMGMGYTLPLFKGTYITSMLGGQFIVGGDSKVDVGNRTANFYRVAPALSFELGWQY